MVWIAQTPILKKAVMGKETTPLSWPIGSSKDISTLMEELGELTEIESIGVRDESVDDEEECIYERTNILQESYNALLEKSGDMQKWLR